MPPILFRYASYTYHTRAVYKFMCAHFFVDIIYGIVTWHHQYTQFSIRFFLPLVLSFCAIIIFFFLDFSVFDSLSLFLCMFLSSIYFTHAFS